MAGSILAQSSLYATGAAPNPTLDQRPNPVFPDADPKWRRTWDAALEVLQQNVKVVPRYDQPVLLEGAVYPGV